MDSNTVILDMETTTDKLLATLARFDEADFNRHPAEGVWSAGDIGEHISITDKRTASVMGETGIPANRPADEKIAGMKTVLLDRIQTIAVPDALKPSPGPKEPEEILHRIKTVNSILVEKMLSLDLNEIVPTEHRRYGIMTRLEWVYFSIYHTQRHIAQLEDLYHRIMPAGQS